MIRYTSDHSVKCKPFLSCPDFAREKTLYYNDRIKFTSEVLHGIISQTGHNISDIVQCQRTGKRCRAFPEKRTQPEYAEKGDR